MSPSKRRKSRQTTTTSLIVFSIVLIILVFEALTSQDLLAGLGGGNAVTESVSTAIPGSEAWYAVFFTNPEAAGAASFTDGPDQVLAAAIENARMSVDVAIYDFDLASLRDALLSAQRRGANVRVVVDSDNRDEAEVQALIAGDIPVLGDRREGLMHNKFVIIDRSEVWTGSMNFTGNDAYRNNNNLMRIRSSRLAENYLAEFEEMFVDDDFGPGSPANTPYSNFSVDGTPLEVYFSPDDGTAARLVDLIGSAQESIYFLAYSFTADDLAAAMLARSNAGVTVSGVFEESQYRANIGTEFDLFRLNKLDVQLDGNPRNMHHKVIVIDRSTVVTGSYNFSANAEKSNDENTLIIHNPEIAALYLAEFERVFGQAEK
jgi:phosphatidylserine/phosphatidylglycerophosphate/cardiolipin synthase-like enzyme